MSATVSDHMMLLKSKEQPYEPVFEKTSWLYVNDTKQKPFLNVPIV